MTTILGCVIIRYTQCYESETSYAPVSHIRHLCWLFLVEYTKRLTKRLTHLTKAEHCVGDRAVATGEYR